MKVIYEMGVKQTGQRINYKIESMEIEDVDINWNLSKCGLLENITLELKEITLYTDSEGYIVPQDYKNIEEKIYRIALFISNNFFIKTGLDIINSNSILNSSPELISESKEEDDVFEKNPRRGYSSIDGECFVIKRFDSNECMSYKYSAAIASYADGLRIENVLQKYEQFYKVIEHFFSKEGSELDNKVSKYAQNIEHIYTEEKIRYLRQLRNKCIHPKAYFGHINSEDIESVKEINTQLNDLKNLAKLLIENPPKS